MEKLREERTKLANQLNELIKVGNKLANCRDSRDLSYYENKWKEAVAEIIKENN